MGRARHRLGRHGRRDRGARRAPYRECVRPLAAGSLRRAPVGVPMSGRSC